MSTPNPGTMAGTVPGQHKDSGDHSGGHGGQDGGGQQQATQQPGGHLSDADLQNGKLPLPGGSHTTPATAPTLEDHAEASKHDQMPGEKYDKDHPGDWDNQIKRATYLHQTGKKQDPTPDHGGKGYQFDPEGLQSLVSELQDIKRDAEKFEGKLEDAQSAVRAPAHDPKSRQHAGALIKSLGKAQHEAHESAQYVGDLAKNLEATLKDYKRTEGQNAEDLRRNQT